MDVKMLPVIPGSDIHPRNASIHSRVECRISGRSAMAPPLQRGTPTASSPSATLFAMPAKYPSTSSIGTSCGSYASAWSWSVNSACS